MLSYLVNQVLLGFITQVDDGDLKLALEIALATLGEGIGGRNLVGNALADGEAHHGGEQSDRETHL